jgi:hypothetical protein
MADYHSDCGWQIIIRKVCLRTIIVVGILDGGLLRDCHRPVAIQFVELHYINLYQVLLFRGEHF